ncbi:MAG: hypothetical protein SVR08_17285, partial [Spirochaetota bacterium]|nr:hypothetical protein [Spirochaetota bacterium]
MIIHRIIIPIILLFVIFSISGCIDDSAVEYNEYSIDNITPPVDKQGAELEKKVHIGHDLPVNISLTATYDEEN